MPNKLNLAIGNNISDTLSTSMGSTDLTIPVNTVALFGTNGGKVIIDRNTSSEEIAYTTGVSGSSLVVPTGGRGAEGTTAVGHNAGATVESVPTAGDWNDTINTLLNLFKVADGTMDITKLGTIMYVADTGTANAYAATLVPTLASYTAGTVVRFKAANTNTGASTLNVNGLGTKAIKKLDGATALAANDIIAGQVITCVYDGTNFQMVNPSGTAPATAGIDGWTSLSSTLTYTSTDGHTFVVGSSADVTGTVQTGDRIKFTNNSTTFYGIVTAITSSAITLYGGTMYSVANSTITSPSYSHAKAPFGFSTDPSIWTEQVTDTTLRSQSSPTTSTWYNLGSITMAIPIGKWNVQYFVFASNTSNNTEPSEAYVTLSTANNTQSDAEFTAVISLSSTTITGNSYIASTLTRGKFLSLTTKTSYYLNTMADVSSTLIQNLNDLSTLVINAICAYL